MPNRIIKESVCYSEDINKLNPDEEVFFYRLMVNCDDYGRMDARIPILKSRLYPLKEHMKSSDIKRYLMKLAEIKPEPLIILYEKSNTQYLQMTKWDKHQQIRAKRSKYPALTDSDTNMISSDINGNQMSAYVPENPNPNLESESESESESECNVVRDIIDYLNQKAGTTYKHTSQKTKDLIQARLNEKFTLEDFYKVIDNKVAEWMDTEWQKFLRPETLFSNKFEGYLNQKLIQKQQELNNPFA